MTKNNQIKFIKHFALFLSVFVLFLFSYQNLHFKRIDSIKKVQEDFINDEKVSPKRLFNECWLIVKNNYYISDLNNQNWYKWKKRYYNKIKTQEDAELAINTMLASLDDNYSKFLAEEEFSQQNNSINSKLYGIGINIASLAGKTYIINVLENSPAYNNDIKNGDIILKVNEVDVQGQTIYQVAQLIKSESTNYVNLEVLRGTEKIARNIKKEEIKIKTVDYKKVSDNVGYIRISSFIGVETPKEFIIALNRLKDAKGLILDLRGNSGGLFQNAIIVANLFMEKGVIVNVIARQGKKNTYEANDKGCIYKNPLVVLIDSDTASASEILSSALHDNNRAVLVGTKTYGKGLVQKVFSLPNKSGINLTIARYLTPKNADINKQGIKPDYLVNFTHNDFVNNVDPQLSWAKNYLEKVVSEL